MIRINSITPDAFLIQATTHTMVMIGKFEGGGRVFSPGIPNSHELVRFLLSSVSPWTSDPDGGNEKAKCSPPVLLDASSVLWHSCPVSDADAVSPWPGKARNSMDSVSSAWMFLRRRSSRQLILVLSDIIVSWRTAALACEFAFAVEPERRDCDICLM